MKKKVIAIVAVAAVLAFAFWYGGNAPGLRGWSAGGPAPAPTVPARTASAAPAEAVPPTPAAGTADGDALIPGANDTPTPADIPAPTESPEPSAEPAAPPGAGLEKRPGGVEGSLSAAEKEALAAQLAEGEGAQRERGDADYATLQGMVLDPETGKDKYLTDPVPEGKPLPVEPQDVTFSDVTHTCTLSVSCATILDNLDWLDPEKVELVPEDGVIFPETEVTFYEGESVFNLLQREMKKARIHMEFVNTPIYNSAYIEGIHNLYEFDCGELSGWMYKVNGWFPNYGCSRYALRAGDVVEWVYTCDLGYDVGGGYSAGS